MFTFHGHDDMGGEPRRKTWTASANCRIIAAHSAAAVAQKPAIEPLRELPDWAEGLLRNDPAVTKALYHAHFQAVKAYVLKNSGTVEDARDMYQEAFLALWLKVKQNAQAPLGTDPGGFLYQVAKNKWLDVLRSAARRHLHVVQQGNLAAQPATGQQERAELEKQLEALRDIYQHLDERCKRVLHLFYFVRQDLASIASELHVDTESIRTIKYRCMMKLRAARHSIRADRQGEP